MEKYLVRVVEGHYNLEDLNTTIKECMTVDVVGGESQVISLLGLIRTLAEEAKHKLTVNVLKETLNTVEGENWFHYSIFKSFKTALEKEGDEQLKITNVSTSSNNAESARANLK